MVERILVRSDFAQHHCSYLVYAVSRFFHFGGFEFQSMTLEVGGKVFHFAVKLHLTSVTLWLLNSGLIEALRCVHLCLLFFFKLNDMPTQTHIEIRLFLPLLSFYTAFISPIQRGLERMHAQ